MLPAVIVFDLDGTLIDSAADLAAAINSMLAELGCAPLPLTEVRGMIGDGVAMLVARALTARQCERADRDEAAQIFMRHYEADATSRTTAFPGTGEALQALHAAAIPLAVCTNKPERISSRILSKLGLARYFARVVGGDTLPYRKPDPRVLQHLLEAFGARREDAFLVGDSEVDAATASSAGVPFVLMKHGYRRGPAAAIACAAALDGFEQLPALVRALQR